MTSAKEEINGWPIWYEKYGCGPNPLLLIPGAIGTGITDFEYQLKGENALDLEKFTIIAVEAPGWGRSRPPLRPYGSDLYNNDAECFVKLMQCLGFEKFSVIGWSDGAKVALVLAINYPTNVKSIIVWGILAFLSEKVYRILLSTKNVDNWGREKIENYLKIYSNRNEIQELWDRHMNFVVNYRKYFPEGVFKNKFHLIECPVLIIHGDKDPLVPIEQPLHVLTNVKGAKFHRFPLGRHDLHQVYRSEFKKLAEDFLFSN